MPSEFYYRRAIRVLGVEGANLGDAKNLSTKDEEAFFKLVKEGIKTLETLATGRALFTALDLSEKTVTIFSGGHKMESVTTMNPTGIDSEVKASVRPFRQRHKNLPLGMRGDDPKNSDQVKGYKEELAKIGMFEKHKANMAGELNVILTRAGKSHEWLAGRLNVKKEIVEGMAAGEVKIDDNTYFSICFILYDFLTPGQGVAAAIRLQPVEKLRASPNVEYNPKKNPNDVPGYILLGHELIHAWRIMVGRRLVRLGWEEEAMTAGISIFANHELTENNLRKDAGLTLRLTYKCTNFSSPLAQELGYK